MGFFTIVEKHKGDSFRKGERFATVEVRGTRYYVSITKEKRVRLAYSSKHGYQWGGTVREKNTGKVLYDDRVNSTTGFVALLEAAFLVPLRKTERKKLARQIQSNEDHLESMVFGWNYTTDTGATVKTEPYGSPRLHKEAEDYLNVLKAKLARHDAVADAFKLSTAA